MKVVINKCYGGASLSREGVLLGRDLSGNPNWMAPTIVGDRRDDGTLVTADYGHLDDDPEVRTNPLLIQIVERLGESASGRCAALRVVEIPDDVEFTIQNYDGVEWIAEEHRTWG